jgi:dihydroorotate dehydrogenase
MLTDPERANRTVVGALSIFPESPNPKLDDRLATTVAGVRFPSPFGLAAGADKNARARTLSNRLFGFIEVGTLTPKPQAGNSGTRVFRLAEDEGVINRMGFPNEGMDAAYKNLERRLAKSAITGVNIGANKDSVDRIQDYVIGYQRMSPVASYITVNISSPNTPGLRDLQSDSFLRDLLNRLDDVVEKKCPVFLKVSPDLTDSEIGLLCDTCENHKIGAVIVGNTTLQRPEGLKSGNRTEAGGLSGRPLAPIAKAALLTFRRHLNGRIPLVGVGGISSGADVYHRMRSGADLVQIYTAITYGKALPWRVRSDLLQLMERDGVSNISEIVGLDAI